MSTSSGELNRRFNWRAGIGPGVGLFLFLGLCLVIPALTGEIRIPSRGADKSPPLVSREQSPQLFWIAWSMLLVVAIIISIVFFAIQSTEEK
ncbi:MAG: hypothetical protein JSS11_17755 [Verrucomicrobia bacterium]|nr:hypothetical protein [Verrucomicrobiota bacterium]